MRVVPKEMVRSNQIPDILQKFGLEENDPGWKCTCVNYKHQQMVFTAMRLDMVQVAKRSLKLDSWDTPVLSSLRREEGGKN